MEKQDKQWPKKNRGQSSTVESPYGKIPPQSIELEKAVLGAILVEKEAFDNASQILKHNFFYVEAHQKVFKSMQSLHSKNLPIDSLTVVEELKANQDLDLVGGPYTIIKLTDGVISGANIVSHAAKVFEKYLKRELIRITGELNNLAYDDTEDAFALMDYAEKEIGDIGLKNLDSGMISIEKVMFDAVNKIEEWRSSDHGGVTGITTGFSEIDKATRGWQPGDLIIIGARPSVGKTALALNIVRSAAGDKTFKGAIAVWSLEMKAVYLALRMLSAESKTLLHHLQIGKVDDTQMADLLKNAVSVLSKLSIFFDESSHITLQSLSRKARRLKKNNQLKLIVVDYLQLMSSDDKGGNREQEISKISRGLKNLAQELEVPVIALSQLSRDTGAKGIDWSHGPAISSLRESGAVEQDADVIMMLWGPSDEDMKKDPTLVGRRKVRIAKQRNGMLITEELNFKNEIQLFEKIDDFVNPLVKNWKAVNSKDFTVPKSEQSVDEADHLPF